MVFTDRIGSSRGASWHSNSKQRQLANTDRYSLHSRNKK